MKLLSNYCLILAFNVGAVLVQSQSQSDRFEPTAIRDSRQRELREQVRHILRQNNQEGLLSRLDDAIINEALDRVADEYDYHDQTQHAQNAAMFIAENAHSLPSNDEFDDDAVENNNYNNNNNSGEGHDEEGGEGNNQHHDNSLLQNVLDMGNNGECEEGYIANINGTIWMIPEDVDGNVEMLESWVGDNLISFGFEPAIGEWQELYKQLMTLNEEDYLLITAYFRGAYTSGYDWVNVRKLLEKIPSIKAWFEKLEKQYIINTGWCLCYPEDGKHPFHGDGKYKGSLRMILTLGSFNKWMFFRKTEKTNDISDMVGVKLAHGSTVWMTPEGGGYGNSRIEHAALGDARESWFIGLELSLRRDVHDELDDDEALGELYAAMQLADIEGSGDENSGGDEEKDAGDGDAK